MPLWDDARNEDAGELAGNARPVPALDLNLTSDEQRRVAERAHEVLVALDNYSHPKASVLVALSDDETPNRHSSLNKDGQPFSAGATTRHVMDYVQPLLGLPNSPDRETGRDYWIGPLVELGLVERIYVSKAKERKGGASLVREGHEVGKSPNNAYRLTPEFRDLLRCPDDEWPARLEEFVADDEQRHLRATQARAASVESDHGALIRMAVEVLTEGRLSGFELLYVDDGDEARVKSEYEPLLERMGLKFTLDDKYPDAILGRFGSRELWVIDAVVSDGEIDVGRRDAIADWAERHGCRVVGFVTAYHDWKRASARQGKMKNVAVGTYLWVAEDGGKLWRAESVAASGGE